MAARPLRAFADPDFHENPDVAIRRRAAPGLRRLPHELRRTGTGSGRADPALANSDPLGAGWFFKVKLSDASQLDALMDETAYSSFAASA